MFQRAALGFVLANGTVVTDRAADFMEEGIHDWLSVALGLSLDTGADATIFASAARRMRENRI